MLCAQAGQAVNEWRELEAAAHALLRSTQCIKYTRRWEPQVARHRKAYFQYVSHELKKKKN